MKQLQEIVRTHILKLRSEITPLYNHLSGLSKHILLNSNESPYNKPYNRYPDPLQERLKAEISKIKAVPVEKILLTNGEDEAIDLCYRLFCEPNIDNVVSIAPTYIMYKERAAINNVEYRAVPLENNYLLSANKLLKVCDKNTKIIWLCSPNNPTGNNLIIEEIEQLLAVFNGIVVIDEAYSDFSKHPVFRHRLEEYPNLIVLNTFSNVWGCAGISLGMAFADEKIISLFNKIKLPYNISMLTQNKALEILSRRFDIEDWLKILLLERNRVMRSFAELPFCERVYPSDANFFLAKVDNAESVYSFLLSKGIVVYMEKQCTNSLRITIGTKSENNELIGALRQFK